jgi:hypothetical protein
MNALTQEAEAKYLEGSTGAEYWRRLRQFNALAGGAR